jgi:hypothetical protein
MCGRYRERERETDTDGKSSNPMCMEFNIPSLDGRATQDYFSLAVVTCAYLGPYV